MQKSGGTEDLRVRRTRKMLQEALIQLTVEKGFSAVTVRDITERAMVNRSTFYRHYLDKYQLLDEYMDDVEAMTSREMFLAEKLGQVVSDVPPGPVLLLRHVQQFADFYRVMLGDKGDCAFIKRFRQHSEKRFRYLLEYYGKDTDPNEPPIEMRLNYISCAGVGAILWWLENDQPCPPEQLALWLSQISTASAGVPFKNVPVEG